MRVYGMSACVAACSNLRVSYIMRVYGLATCVAVCFHTVAVLTVGFGHIAQGRAYKHVAQTELLS